MTSIKKRTNDELNNDMNNDVSNKRTKYEDDSLENLSRLLFPPTDKPPVQVINSVTKHRSSKNVSTFCKNPYCNHKTLLEDPTSVIIPNVKNIRNIEDLITLGKSYHCQKNLTFAGLNLRILCNLVSPLTELSKMVGMTSVKEHIVNQILFFLQGHHSGNKCNNCIDCTYGLTCLNSQTEMLHTVISGPPGVGKTEFGKILGKVYKEMGILSKGTFKLVTRADLVAGYLGQTAIKTQEVIDSAMGGVLFIDEAYSLGNSDLRDSFSKECIDTLNQNLSERRDFLCIIAGYENELEKCFFKYNEGLRRRFTFRYNIVPYNHEELFEIFNRKVDAINWSTFYTPQIDDSQEILDNKKSMKSQVVSLFKQNTRSFPNYGGDMETLVLNCKIVHSQRCSFDETHKKCLSLEDITKGIQTFVNHRRYDKKHNNEVSNVLNVDFNTNVGIYSKN